jgi:hypothetical protein
MPLHDVRVSVRAGMPVRRVFEPVSGAEVPFTASGGRVELHFDRIGLHEMRVLE